MWIFGRHKHLAEGKLSEYVSGRLPPYHKERLERSLDQCVTCRQVLESLQMTSSLLRGLPAYELPRSFVFAAAPATASPVPAMGVSATRSWTFRPPGWAYAGAASVVGLAVAVFVLSSDVSQWLPGAEREPPQSEAAAEFPAQPASLPAPMPLAEERLASVPPLPEVAAEVAVMAESGSTSDAPAPAAPAASDSSSAARQEMMDIPPTPVPEAASLAPESNEASVRDLAPGEASSEATMEQAPAAVPAAVPRAEEQVEGVAAEPDGTSDDVGEIADLEPPTASPAMAMAKESPQEQAAALAPPLDSDQPGAAAESMQPAAVSQEPTPVPGKQESQPAKKVEVIASSEPGVAARVGGSMAEPEQAAESPKQDSSQVNAGERVAEGAFTSGAWTAGDVAAEACISAKCAC